MTTQVYLAPPIPVTVKPVGELGRILPDLEATMDGLARIWRDTWIGISRRRHDGSALSGILPLPLCTNVVLYAAGTSDRLTGDRSRLEATFPVDKAIDTLVGLYYEMRCSAGFNSHVGLLLRPASFTVFHQAGAKVTAELTVGPQVGGHAALEEIEAIKRAFAGRLDFDQAVAP